MLRFAAAKRRPLGELSPQATEGVGVQQRTFEMLPRFLLPKNDKCAILLP